MSQHNKAYREQDEMVCPDCGKRWDLDDVEPDCLPEFQVLDKNGHRIKLHCHNTKEAEQKARQLGVEVSMVVPV